jgi:hypothetical protein
MEGRRKDGVEKGTQQCPSMSKGSEIYIYTVVI